MVGVNPTGKDFEVGNVYIACGYKPKSNNMTIRKPGAPFYAGEVLAPGQCLTAVEVTTWAPDERLPDNCVKTIKFLVTGGIADSAKHFQTQIMEATVSVSDSTRFANLITATVETE